MATDVDVQFFSHLNGLTLGNNWGDLIRMLDKALVTGIDFTQITAASIDEQGDVHITLYAAHNAMLFQIVELTGFTPASLNQKYRIKGVPNTTQLILKPKTDIVERSITTTGAAKLSSLGYEIIFRDTGDVKRVYRAKNPTAKHPFIRVDETISDGTNSYTSTYAKSAMVGLLENMTHIDDFQNPDVLQLPFDPSDPAKNWKITGTGTSCVRGWSKWYWATIFGTNLNSQESNAPAIGDRSFTITGDKDAFYFMISARQANLITKVTYGCGLFESAADIDSENAPWFLMTELTTLTAGTSRTLNYSALMANSNQSRFLVVPQSFTSGAGYAHAIPILVNYHSGGINLTPLSDFPVIGVPFYDEQGALRGSLKHIHAILKSISTNTETKPILSDNSMFVVDTAGYTSVQYGYLAYYLGELE